MKSSLWQRGTQGVFSSRGAALLLVLGTAWFAGADWAQFRGPDATSVVPNVTLPTTWSDTQNVAWKSDLPGRGASSPIVVGNRVVVTCSDGPIQERMLVVAYDSTSGKQAWRRQFWATGRPYSHPDSANAAPTPASDGQRIYAFYSSNDLVCLDLDGNLQWYRGLAYDFPKAGNDVGMASSPVVIGSTVIVQVENYGDSFAMGLDTTTGETRWRIPRKAGMNWASPTRFDVAGTSLVLLQSPGLLTAHDPRTGEQVWQFEAACESIPSVVGVKGRVYVPASGLTALDLTDGSAPKLAWEAKQLSSGAASPVVAGNRVYTMNNAGVLACGDVESGKVLWQLRVGGRHWATPIMAGGLIYCINQEGKAKVIKPGDEKGEVVGESDFGTRIQGSPAVTGNAMFVRSDKHLWKITNAK